jgi:hypothetical protein
VEKVYNCQKTDTGISLDWKDGQWTMNEHFTFPELEEMRIRIPDLISNPELFRIDLLEHRIYVSQSGRNAY